jgi:hypothetical protein
MINTVERKAFSEKYQPSTQTHIIRTVSQAQKHVAWKNTSSIAKISLIVSEKILQIAPDINERTKYKNMHHIFFKPLINKKDTPSRPSLIFQVFHQHQADTGVMRKSSLIIFSRLLDLYIYSSGPERKGESCLGRSVRRMDG